MSERSVTRGEYRVLWPDGVEDGPFETQQDAQEWCDQWPTPANIQHRTITTTRTDWEDLS